jgi:hypothetical protein
MNPVDAGRAPPMEPVLSDGHPWWPRRLAPARQVAGRAATVAAPEVSPVEGLASLKPSRSETGLSRNYRYLSPILTQPTTNVHTSSYRRQLLPVGQESIIVII